MALAAQRLGDPMFPASVASALRISICVVWSSDAGETHEVVLAATENRGNKTMTLSGRH